MKTIFYLIIAICLIGFGGWQQFQASGVSPVDQARCEDIVRAQYSEDAEAIATLIGRCNEPGMVAMFDARNSNAAAEDAARSIAAANQNDIVSTLINCAFIGAGIGALGAAAGTMRRKA